MAAQQSEWLENTRMQVATQRRRRAASGFTLVELLMVIAIIGTLMAMLSVAVWKVLDFAKQGRIIVEIQQLQSAMQAYKEKSIQYPPCLGEAQDTTANLNIRKVHFMRHIQAAFANANYGPTAGNFDTLRNQIASTAFGTGTQIYRYRKAVGTITALDLNTLDQAEALVFWLGGMPTPVDGTTGLPIVANRLFGFNRDRDNPFRRDSTAQELVDAMRFRTDSLFDFVQDRLIDNDDDGWLEYSPTSYRDGEYSAPYVYFDAPTYVASTTAPGVLPFNIPNLTGYPRSGELLAATFSNRWGMAVPMADVYVSGTKTPIRWKRPESFQIIAPGKDGMYSTPTNVTSNDLSTLMRMPLFPSGDTYSKATSYTAKTSYMNQELDNLTNLADSTLDEARQAVR
ncbi:MAG: type II secretion system GspH family protein [Planctomycetia bacterium]|nr:type II secretion system GspH family protein [Planctomycetia bacterium]